MAEIRILYSRPTMFDLTIMNKNEPMLRIELTGFLPSRQVSTQLALPCGLTDTVLHHMNDRIRGNSDWNHGLSPAWSTVFLNPSSDISGQVP
jgi:hypothetical protein